MNSVKNHTVSPSEMHLLKTPYIIDVREKEELHQGTIPESHHFPLSEFNQNRRPDLPQNCDILVYCQKGMRSEYMMHILQNEGHTNIFNLQGGYEEWRKEND